MIIDGFMFNNELDLLEMRLEELYPVVDLFVLVQAHHTFRGQYKGTSFDKNDPRWAPYIDKIKSYSFGLSGGSGPWEREAYQRNKVGEIIKDEAYYDPNAICIISDVDEIPRREVISSLSLRADDLHRFPAGLSMDMYYYALNVSAGGWGAARVCLADDLVEAQSLRHSDPTWFIPDAGWHFSYLGDDEFISNKLKAFSHAELDVPEVHKNIAANRAGLLDPFNHREKLRVVEIDDTWPKAVKNNPERWQRYIWTP